VVGQGFFQPTGAVMGAFKLKLLALEIFLQQLAQFCVVVNKKY
jgi:hypothetical protein